MTAEATVHLVRHGATEWAKNGRHTSITDLPLLTEGEEQATRLGPRLQATDFGTVYTSPRLRARETARLAGFGNAVIDPDLAEWHYGAYEGLTRTAIHDLDPTWQVWTGPTPGGETPDQVAQRLDGVISRIRATPGPSLVFSHGHALRALEARWLGLPVSSGQLLTLDTATVSVLGHDRGRPVIRVWNS